MECVRQSLWILLSFIASQVMATPIDIADAAESSPPLALIAVAAALLVCGILLLIGCAEICQREAGFKDFDNEDVTSDPSLQSHVSEFTMYPPPAESTPEQPVMFEPLPDITHSARPLVSNATVLRPKVGMVKARSLERADSEENLEEVPQVDPIQDKLKLQSLLTNSRNIIPRSQLQYIKELGTGYFGKVLQGEGQKILPGHKKTKVVIQMLNEEAETHDQLTFLQEATAYREIDNHNVLKVLGQCVETTPYLVVMELCPFGDVKTYLRSHRIAMDSFNEKGILLKFASDMAAGLMALHQYNFVHHDFATRNCQLSSDLTVKVGDYGLGEELYKEDYYLDPNGDPVPIRWLAPETLIYGNDGSLTVRPQTKVSNIWSYGVALWETVQFGSMPYNDLSNEHVLRLVVKEKSLKLPKPDLPIVHLDRLHQLMQLCWAEPSQRPSLRELRIMILHLMSSKINADSSTFEQKWNQLMPRKQPRTTRADSNLSNGVVTSQPGGNKRPSGFESDFVTLDPRRLAHDGGYANHDVSLADELAQVHRSPAEDDDMLAASSPKNEVSLEAELSAAFSANGTAESEDDLSFSKNEPSNTTITEDLIEVEDASLDNMPDIVVANTVQSDSPEFLTSTPKGKVPPSSSTSPDISLEDRGEPDGHGTPEATSSPRIIVSADTSSEYHSALASRSRNEHETSDDGSLFGEKKFAALLQTVAAPSFDGDEFEGLSSSFDSGADKSVEEDIFEKIVETPETPTTPKAYQKVPTEEGEKASVNIETAVKIENPTPHDTPLLGVHESTPDSETEKC